MNRLLNFLLGYKCPKCNYRGLSVCDSSYNLKNYWCDFCFIEVRINKDTE